MKFENVDRVNFEFEDCLIDEVADNSEALDGKFLPGAGILFAFVLVDIKPDLGTFDDFLETSTYCQFASNRC